ncbi:AP2 domain-containing protein [Bacillus sp. AFS073361]|uniref:AP2 domain-containing protein n=1 Tax=Bacillus sp. AFS073361 TaxID=2033511 RepID=UPI000BF8C6A8|nr:AP2 domain-containing protein [Bacillus sp. AFS073361]PFP30237.1 AP2 domain-containing protein [Bacillus sp. AFS073361]
MPKLNDLTDKKFGRLSVLSRAGTNKSKKPIWECLCDCGNVTIVVGAELVKGTTKSCGCLRKEVTAQRTQTHGMRKTRFYEIWYAMKKRCRDEHNISYQYYGGRGIRVCDRWGSFENFKADMYAAYLDHSEKHGEKQTTVDRIDNNKDYTPENTRWATYTIQNRNTRIRSDNKTGYKGVYKRYEGGGYTAHIRVNNEQIYLGTFDNIENAIEARIDAEKTYWEAI